MGKYNVEIDYHQLPHSGCSQKFANTIGRKRNYIINVHYALTFIPLFMVFKIDCRTFDGELFQNSLLFNAYEHLTANNDTDYESFISLN